VDTISEIENFLIFSSIFKSLELTDEIIKITILFYSILFYSILLGAKREASSAFLSGFQAGDMG
jgi:hypothetical protein